MIGLLVAAQLAVIAHGPDTATTCAPFEVTVAARARGTTPPYIAPPASSASMQLLRSTMISSVERDGAGQPTALTEATFTLATNSIGRVPLPSFSASAGSERGASAPPAVEVHASNVPLAPTVVVRAWLDRGGHVSPSDTLYVGQQVDYVVDVQLNETARQRLRRNPTFFPPEMPGVLAYDLAPPAALPRAGRHCFETLSYRRALFPLFAGPSVISPASLTYALPLSTSFFSREESFELRTDSVRFVAMDVPAVGRPADFGGAVGAMTATARLATQKARMGDPVVVTLRVEGTGNVKLWPRPPLSLDWATIANGEERVEIDTSLAQVRGAKEFDWLLTPRKAGQQIVPSLDYPHFDADRRAYAVGHTAPLTIDVSAASLASIDSAPVARYALRRTLRGEVPDSVPSRPWFWILLAVAPVPAATRRLRDTRRRRRTTSSAMKRLAFAAAKSQRLTARELRRLFLDAARERVPETSGSTLRGDFARTLRRGGVTAETADSASALLERLDSAAFSAAGAIDQSAAVSAAAIVKAIDREAVRPVSKRGGAVTASIALVFLLGASALLGALPSGQTTAFTEGVEAYDRGAFDSSERLFARVVARAPRAEDAWANLGAASLSRSDSAAAVRAWERALRLDPLDVETRDRLNAMQPSSLRSPGYVAPVTVNLLALTALACWIGAWLLLAIPPRHRPLAARPIAGGTIVVAVLALAGSLELRGHLDPRGLAVLRVSRLLVDAPGSQAGVASGATGETGALGAREGAWVRISLDGARAGWVPVASVLLLDAPPADN